MQRLVVKNSSSTSSQPRPTRRTALILTTGLFGGFMGARGSKAQSGEWKPRPEGTPLGQKVSKLGYDITPLTVEERKKAASGLNDLEKRVTLEAGTERAFTGKFANGVPWNAKGEGIYVSAVGDLPLFSSDTKFDSGTGWPSFFAPIDPEHIREVTDNSIPFMPRVEVVDARSGAHLGHVFDDGPAPTGKRYCMNAASLKFIPKDQIASIPKEFKLN